MMDDGLYQFPNTPQFRNGDGKDGAVSPYNQEQEQYPGQFVMTSE